MLYFYPAIYILGILSSYTDIKYNLIKNKYLLFAISYGLAIYFYLFFIKQHFFISIKLLSWNLFVAICIAYILYLKRLWAPGDAKLFITLSFLTPSLKYVWLFKLPSLALFININIIGIIFIIVFEGKNIIFNLKSTQLSIFKEKLRRFSYSLSITFSITWIIWFLFSKINFSQPLIKFILIYLSYFFIFKLIERMKSHRFLLILVLSVGVLIRLLIQPQFFSSLAKLSEYILCILKYSIVFSLFDILLVKQSSKVNNKDIIKKMPFAPIMFIGATTIESPLIYLVIRFLRLLRA